MELSRASDLKRFQSLWNRVLLDGKADTSNEIHQQLLTSYRESQRVYHTLDHIEHCLTMFDRVYSLFDNPDAVELTIWYHDVIYIPGATDNEQLSADRFMRETEGLFPESLRQSVYGYIMATLHNGTNLDDADARLLVDIDLSSFGLPWDDFLFDSSKVRKEMAHLPDEVFYPKQMSFQKALLEQPRFYQSPYFFENYEAQARHNLQDYFIYLKENRSFSG